MRQRFIQRLRALVKLERLSLLAGGRDVYETTRRSLLSLEARAGALVFAGLWLLSQAQAPTLNPYPFDPGPAFNRLLEDSWLSLDFFRVLVFAFFTMVGAVLGLFIRHAWDLLEEFAPVPPRRGWPRRFRWSFAVAGILFLHCGFLLSAMRAHPSLYLGAFHDRGWILRLFQDWLATGFLSFTGRLWTFTSFAVLFAGLVQIARHILRWFRGFPVPTRVATGVLGVGTVLFVAGLWGVFRFHRPSNAGPNVVVLAVEGLRTEDLEDPEHAPYLYELAHRGRTFAACVPTVPQREASLMTLLTGRSPLSHGIRHAFPSGGDVFLGADSLPARLHRADFTVEAASDAGGDLLGRLAPAFDRVRAPDLSAPGLVRRDCLRRSVHLLPYLRGTFARRFLPPLRAVSELSDPRLLASEGEAMLKQLRFRTRFFLLLHFSGRPSVGAGEIDKAVGRLLETLNDLNLDDSTWIALWSPFAAPGGGDVSSPDRFKAPLVLVGPSRRAATRRVEALVRDMDVAPTLLSVVGLPVPDVMEGLPLLEVDPETEGFLERDVYTETDLWTAPEDNPLPPGDRLSYGPPSAWLEEDPEAAARLRIRPAVEDAVLSYRHRLLQTGGERLVYRPSRRGVLFEYYDLVKDPGTKINLAPAVGDGAPRERAPRDQRHPRTGTAPADRVRELKEVLFQELRREAGWRPQNDFWIPEALMREKE